VQATGLFHIFREAEVETVALRGAELDLHRGAWTSVMGPSGSGKSTLVAVLAGLLEPSRGSVLFAGEDITRLPPARPAARAATCSSGGGVRAGRHRRADGRDPASARQPPCASHETVPRR
jgi:ABC-type lipoprotein export system ATPase subunit